MQRNSVYRVFLTKNSEYHVRSGVCFNVRDRRTGNWLAEHEAIGLPLSDVFADEAGEVRAASMPMVGEPLSFQLQDRKFQTSPVLSVEVRGGSEVTPHWETMVVRRQAQPLSQDTRQQNQPRLKP